MSGRQSFLRAVLVLLVLCPALPSAGQTGNRLLWQIGTPDGSYREFAIAGSFVEYARSFPHDVTYQIGRSRGDRDWPYIHPGPSDPWAGARTHPFRIDFDLAAAPSTPCRLNVYLVDARHDSPQVLEIDINGRRKYRFALVPGVGEDSLTDPGAGRQSCVGLPFSPALLQSGRNRITLTVVNACWLLYDAVSLETGPSIPSAPELVEVSAHVPSPGEPVSVAVKNLWRRGRRRAVPRGPPAGCRDGACGAWAERLLAAGATRSRRSSTPRLDHGRRACPARGGAVATLPLAPWTARWRLPRVRDCRAVSRVQPPLPRRREVRR